MGIARGVGLVALVTAQQAMAETPAAKGNAAIPTVAAVADDDAQAGGDTIVVTAARTVPPQVR